MAQETTSPSEFVVVKPGTEVAEKGFGEVV